MKRQLARLAVGTVLALTALSNSVSLVAADPPPTPAPGTLLIVAGTGEKGFSGDSGPATQARMNGPFGVAVDTAGNLFIAEKVNARVRRVGPDGIIHTVVGGGNTPSIPVEGIPATEARLGDVQSLAFDGAGNLFIAGYYSGRVWKVSPQGQITTIHRGGNPFGVAVDAAGNLFFMDDASQRVQKVTPEGIISTVAGGGKKPPRTADGGPATEARLNVAAELAVDSAGNLFISDRYDYRVRKVTPEGIISTVAGNGGRGFSGDGGLATQARFKEPAAWRWTAPATCSSRIGRTTGCGR
jgi:hypothetical protein